MVPHWWTECGGWSHVQYSERLWTGSSECLCFSLRERRVEDQKGLKKGHLLQMCEVNAHKNPLETGLAKISYPLRVTLDRSCS